MRISLILGVTLALTKRKIWRAFIAWVTVWILIFGYGVKTYALSVEDERKLGEKFMSLIKKEMEFIEDPQITSYVSKIGERIVSQTGHQPFECKFYVINSSELNAFAAPAGQVFINSGLIAILDKEGELASIISHEMGHVTARHIAKRIEKSKVLSWITLAGALAGMLLGKGSDAGAALATSSMAAGASLTLKYTRDDEREADRLGLKFMIKAGYDGSDMIEAFKKLRKHGLVSSEIPPYLSTHPGLDERIIDLEQRMLFTPSKKAVNEVGVKDKAAGDGTLKPLSANTSLTGFTLHSEKVAENNEFRRVKILLMAKYSDPQKTLSFLKSELKSNPQDFFAHYGLGLTYKRIKRMDKALKEFEIASSLKPNAAFILRELGICYLYKGDFNLSIKSLRKATTIDPEDNDAYYYLARSYQESGNKDTSLKIYQYLKTKGFDSPDVYYNIGVIYGEKGLWGPAHYHLAVFFKKKGERDNALYHFRQALNFYQGDSKKEREINQEIGEVSRNIP